MSASPSALRLRPGYCLLALSEAAARLGGFSDVLYIEWLLIAGFPRDEIARFFLGCAAAGFACALALCLGLIRLHTAARQLGYICRVYISDAYVGCLVRHCIYVGPPRGSARRFRPLAPGCPPHSRGGAQIAT